MLLSVLSVTSLCLGFSLNILVILRALSKHFCSGASLEDDENRNKLFDYKSEYSQSSRWYLTDCRMGEWDQFGGS